MLPLRYALTLAFLVGCAMARRSVKVALTQKFFEFFSPDAKEKIDSQIRQTVTPDVIEPGMFSVIEATDMKIYDFFPPKLDFEILPEGRLAWRASSGGQLNIHGQWRLSFLSLFLEGQFEADANDVECFFSIAFDQKEGHPQIHLVDSMLEVSSVSARFFGPFAWAMRLMGTSFKTMLQSAYNERIPQAVSDAIDELNLHFMETPTQFPLENNYTILYEVEPSPRAVNKSLLFGVAARVVKTPPLCPLEPGFIDDAVSKTHMITLSISSQCLNCWLYIAHNARDVFFDYLITKETEPQYLKTTNCTHSHTCIGQFFPILAEMFPNGTVDMQIVSSAAPVFTLARNGAALTGFFHIMFFGHPIKQYPDVLIKISMKTTSVVRNYLDGTTIKANLFYSTLRLKGVASSVGAITDEFLFPFEGLLNHLTGNTTLEKAVNQILEHGVAFPTFGDRSFDRDSTEVSLDRGVLRVHTNIVYNRPNT